MAQVYGQYPNVLFEIWNEPIHQSWSTAIKPYHEELVATIRNHSENLIICGTGTWSQDVDVASLDPVVGDNLAYTLHFYSTTHQEPLRQKARAALRNGAALFVSEWGTCAADGDGALDTSEAIAWSRFLEEHGISDANWAISDKDESCSALVPGASPLGGWAPPALTESGAFVRASLRGEPFPGGASIGHAILLRILLPGVVVALVLLACVAALGDTVRCKCSYRDSDSADGSDSEPEPAHYRPRPAREAIKPENWRRFGTPLPAQSERGHFVAP
mmetsp:Transcript_84902/g.188670  ORF Transcript_84902/g.188670 Transcript_84902/m.188670 type:complete len:275 (+) Transcript_84902:3-827(+)